MAQKIAQIHSKDVNVQQQNVFRCFLASEEFHITAGVLWLRDTEFRGRGQNLKAKARVSRGRDEAEAKNYETEPEVEATILALRPVCPRGLNIPVLVMPIEKWRTFSFPLAHVEAYNLFQVVGGKELKDIQSRSTQKRWR